MKKLFSFCIALAALALLCACNKDPKSETWLKGSVWEADLAGVEVEQTYFGANPFVSVVASGTFQIKIKLLGDGYSLNYEFETEGGGGGEMQTSFRAPIEYEFPKVSLFFGPVSKQRDTGIMSDDFETLHFDTLTCESTNTTAVFTDVDFKRQ